MTAPLPGGFVVRLGRRVRVLSGGRFLVGGTPTKVLSLRPRAVEALRGREVRVGDATSNALAGRLLDAGMAHPVLELLAPSTEEVTIVVPVRDRPSQLERLLATVDEAHRVVVVDDASDDPDAVAKVVADAGAHLVALTVNLGPAGARNAGLARVTTPLVAFVDSDVELSPGALSRLARCFADPGVGLVAPRVRGRLAVSGGSWLARYDADRSALDLGPEPGSVRPRASVAWLPAACLLARTSALGEGFDRRLRLGEDVDLVWRLVGEGRRVLYVPSVEVHHAARAAAGDVLGRRLLYGTSAGELARRHGSAVAPAVVSPWNLAAVAAVVVQRRWSVPVCAGLTALTAVRVRRRLPLDEGANRIAATLALQGLLAGLRQAADLGLRHWWPLGAVGAATCRPLRRFLGLAAVLEAADAYRRSEIALDFPRFLVARRLDDIAYGTGVWLGALRSDAWDALLPDLGWSWSAIRWRRRPAHAERGAYMMTATPTRHTSAPVTS